MQTANGSSLSGAGGGLWGRARPPGTRVGQDRASRLLLPGGTPEPADLMLSSGDAS